jgi:hypothetical protein
MMSAAGYRHLEVDLMATCFTQDDDDDDFSVQSFQILMAH